jgi:hypothetical protein
VEECCAVSQYERSFLPHRLGNWEVPDNSKLQATTLKNRFDTPAARTGKTRFIAGDNGYIADPKHKKAGVTAFTTTADFQRPVYAESKPRWPKVLRPLHSKHFLRSSLHQLQRCCYGMQPVRCLGHAWSCVLRSAQPVRCHRVAIDIRACTHSARWHVRSHAQERQSCLQTNVSWPLAPRATMGHKGLQVENGAAAAGAVPVRL